jgi:hypothetical protein
MPWQRYACSPNMRKHLVAVFSILLMTPAMAKDIDLSKGGMSREYGRTKQALSLKNNAARPRGIGCGRGGRVRA